MALNEEPLFDEQERNSHGELEAQNDEHLAALHRAEEEKLYRHLDDLDGREVPEEGNFQAYLSFNREYKKSSNAKDSNA